MNNFYSNYKPLKFKVSMHDFILLERVESKRRKSSDGSVTSSLRGRKLYLAGEKNKGTFEG